MSEVGAILAVRKTQHGPFRLHAAITQRLKEVMEDQPNWVQLTAVQREALQMIQHKIGRVSGRRPEPRRPLARYRWLRDVGCE